ncbi:uncharacterized protein YbjT (DUF2867 family) [Rhizobium mesoamericanum]|uniref:hypothetical protein n=1 Tax=Rhizobium mesoamericanum TaxID=1079800 RepID=UPI00277EBC20|nr:hypothetical protein [Rhizobium mesoamericanum]MDQ0561887.1 uncharacterized protein YbjT (DUF2867 family) [Rhizobium mesoamericanum]
MKLRGEQHLIMTAPAWTILRMSYYAEALADEARASLDNGVMAALAENRAAFVTRDDVGAAAAGILIGDGHEGAIYDATGEERLTGAERAALIAESPDVRSPSSSFRKSTCAPAWYTPAYPKRSSMPW